jgi:hypothetical protein
MAGKSTLVVVLATGAVVTGIVALPAPDTTSNQAPR